MANDNYKIYIHINKINGKLYVGQTKQIPNRRWRDGEGYKESSHFYHAIKKYGWDNFEHIILFDNLSLEMANIIEEELIRKYNTTDYNNGYNLYYGGDNFEKPTSTKMKLSKYKYYGVNNPNYGNYWSDDKKEALRQKQKSNELYKDDNNPNSKRILCVETGEVFDCIKFALNKYLINSDGSMSVALKNPHRTAARMHWVELNNDNLYLLNSKYERDRYLFNIFKSNKDCILCINDMSIYKSVVELSQLVNVGESCIRNRLIRHEKFVYDGKTYIRLYKYKGEYFNGDQ